MTSPSFLKLCFSLKRRKACTFRPSDECLSVNPLPVGEREGEREREEENGRERERMCMINIWRVQIFHKPTTAFSEVIDAFHSHQLHPYGSHRQLLLYTHMMVAKQRKKVNSN